MAADLTVPPFLLCGSNHGTGSATELPLRQADWVTPIDELGLWISSTHTRSQIHYDQTEILNCLLVGEKEWLFMDTRANYKVIPWAYNSVKGVRNERPVLASSAAITGRVVALIFVGKSTQSGLPSPVYLKVLIRWFSPRI